MILIDPITNGEVETFTDELTARLLRQGFKPKEEKPKPKRTTTRKTTKKGQ